MNLQWTYNDPTMNLQGTSKVPPFGANFFLGEHIFWERALSRNPYSSFWDKWLIDRHINGLTDWCRDKNKPIGPLGFFSWLFFHMSWYFYYFPLFSDRFQYFLLFSIIFSYFLLFPGPFNKPSKNKHKNLDASRGLLFCLLLWRSGKRETNCILFGGLK